ncbi:protein FAM221B-like isoform X1 [Acipenser ruthenus]|uniref:protein FAM221B-like isoform X1 n=2 Tax=Acipenser ruthenus TaxID=7906 RepID=UPI00145A2833|nr:protein FAM221B-like isoform X1 [Acipenser ruthenus]
MDLLLGNRQSKHTATEQVVHSIEMQKRTNEMASQQKSERVVRDAGTGAASHTHFPVSGEKVSVPGATAGKRKEKRNNLDGTQTGSALCPKEGRQVVTKGFTIKPIVPAKKSDVLSVAKAMHREKFGERVKELFDPERDAALKAIQTGIYIGWRSPEYSWDCFRLGDASKCFCGHLLNEHKSYSGISVRVPCAAQSCKCKAFAFIPSRPEEAGEFWLKKRPGFDPAAWRAMCRCKHSHEEHDPTNSHACKKKGCRCQLFESSFVCASCDRHWEQHETFFDTEDSRKKSGLPYGEAYLPFAEMPNLRNAVLTGREGDDSAFKSITKALPSSVNQTSQ